MKDAVFCGNEHVRGTPSNGVNGACRCRNRRIVTPNRYLFERSDDVAEAIHGGARAHEQSTTFGAEGRDFSVHVNRYATRIVRRDCWCPVDDDERQIAHDPVATT